MQEWKNGHKTSVKLSFLPAKENPNQTTVKLVHDGLPEDEVERTREMWRNRVLMRFKHVFGYMTTAWRVLVERKRCDGVMAGWPMTTCASKKRAKAVSVASLTVVDRSFV